MCIPWQRDHNKIPYGTKIIVDNCSNIEGKENVNNKSSVIHGRSVTSTVLPKFQV